MADDTRPSRRRQRARRLLRALRWAFRLVTLLLILVLFGLHLLPWLTNTRAGRSLATRTISRVLNGAEVRLGASRVAPLQERLLLVEGLGLSPRGEAGAPAIELDRLECRWRPLRMFDRCGHVTRLELAGVRGRLRKERGQWNVLSLIPPSEEPIKWRLPLRVRVDAARIEDMDVDVATDEGLTAHLRSMSAAASCDLWGEMEGRAEFRLTSGAADCNATAFRVELGRGFDVRLFGRNDGRLAVLSGDLAVEHLLAAVGRLGETKPVALSAGINARLDLSSGGGQADLRLHVPGLVSDEISLEATRLWPLDFRGTNFFLADLAGLAEALPPGVFKDVEPVQVSGELAARTEFSGSLRAASGLVGEVEMKTSVLASDITAGARLRMGGQDPVAVSAEAQGLHAFLIHGLRFDSGGGGSGSGTMEMTCGVDLLRVAAGDRFSAELYDLGADALVAVAVSGPCRLGLSGGVNAGWVGFSTSKMGHIGFPVDAMFHMEAREPLDPGRARLELEHLSGGIGEVVPSFWLTASALGWDGRELTLAGSATVAVEQALDLVRGSALEVGDLLRDVACKGTVTATFDAQGRLPSGEGGPLEVDGHVQASLRDVSVGPPGRDVTVRSLHVPGLFGFTLAPGFKPRDLGCELSCTAEGIAAPGLPLDGGNGGTEPIRIGRMTATLNGGVSGPELRDIRLEVGLAMSDVNPGLPLTDGGAPAEPLSIEAGLALWAAVPDGDVALRDAYVNVPGLLALRMPRLVLEDMGRRTAAGKVTLELPDVARLAAYAAPMYPPPEEGSRPVVSGRAEGEVSFTGRLPLLAEVVDALQAGGQMQLPAIFPLDAFYQQHVPVDLTARFKLSEGGVSHRLGPGRAVGVSGVAAEASLRLEGGVARGDVSLSVPEVTAPGLPLTAPEFEMAGEWVLRDLDELVFDKLRFSALGGAVAGRSLGFRLAGLAGLPRALEDCPLPGVALQELDLSLRWRATVQGDAVKVVEGLELSGEAGCDLSVELEAGRSLTVTVEPWFREFSLRYETPAGDVALTGVNGRLQLAGRWAIGSAPPAAAMPLSRQVTAPSRAVFGEGVQTGAVDFATASDELFAGPHGVEVGTASALGKELASAFGMEVALRKGGLSVPRFHLRPLGGTMVGSMSVRRSRRELHVSLRGEFTGVDTRRLLPPRMRAFSGDSEINGGVQLDAALSSDRGRVSVNDLTARANITHIGADALDRMLLSLDPNGENPSIVQVRRMLTIAGPRRVTVALEHGFVGIGVELQGLAGGLVGSYTIPRFNVGRLLESDRVAGALAPLAPVMEALSALDAERIVILPDGNVALR